MIYETDIIKGLTQRLTKFFPKVKIENQDIKNCLNKRPCFFVRNITSVDNQSAVNYELNNSSFEIIYFSTFINKGYLELLQTKRLLKASLNKPLSIVKTWQDADKNNFTKTYSVEINSLSTNTNEDDYVLNAIAAIKIEQEIDYADLGADIDALLDSDNITDDENFNREMLTEMNANLTVQGQTIESFTEN